MKASVVGEESCDCDQPASGQICLPVRNRIRFHFLLAGLTVILSGLLWWFEAPFVFPLDDAYITLHNAQVLRSGSDVNYNVSALSGATSLIHLAAVTGFMSLAPAALASFLVATVGFGAYAQGAAALAFRHGLSIQVTSLVVVIALMTGYTAHHLFNGLETGGVLAAVTWTLVLATSPHPSRLLAVLCGLLPFLRPELGALSLALMARQSWIRWRAPRVRSQRMFEIASDVALVLAAALPWLVWSWVETNEIIPSTARAKQVFFAEGGLPLWFKGLISGTALMKGLGPVLISILCVKPRGLAVAIWLFAAAFVGAYTISFPGGLYHNYFRYTYVLLPVAIWALCCVSGSNRRELAKVLLVAGLSWVAVSIPMAWRAHQEGRTITVKEHADLAAWVNANLPADARVLVHDAGYVAFSTSRRLIDVVGLKAPENIADHLRWTASTGGRDRWRAVHQIAARHGATHAIILDDKEGFWSSLGDDLRHAGWTLDLMREPKLPYGYRIFRLTRPDRPLAENPSLRPPTRPTAVY
ncbi:hypothetical protein [Microvirga aerophila]|nr:hypothetical protein [Microvirga aerophila]